MYKTIFVITITIYSVCNILMFYKFVIAVYLYLRERICSLKNSRFASGGICSLKDFL